jgi:hypothetical protein
MMKEKKTHRPDEVFRRTPGGRYVPVGYEWAGFPMDGIWLVQDGKNKASCLIGLEERVPIFALNYRLHEQGIVDAIQKREKEVVKNSGYRLSLQDMARIACDYFAHIAAEKGVK